ncbi:MAG: tetratricopeptide repeat protein [Pirellulales bacterium]
MFSIAWSLALGIITSQLQAVQPPDQFPREAVKLYRQALVLADSETPELAFTVLEQLCVAHPKSPLAAISALRIAESRLAANNIEEARLILLATIGHQSDVSLSDVTRIDPKFEFQLKFLLQQLIAKSETQAQIDSLEAWLKESNVKLAVSADADNREPSTLQFLQSMLGDEVSLMHARRGQFRRAIEVLDQLPSPLTEAQQKAVQLELPLALLQSKATKEDLDWIFTRRSESSLPISGRISLQLALGEAQRQHGDFDKASETFTALSLQIKELIAKTAPIESGETNNVYSTSDSSTNSLKPTNLISALRTLPTGKELVDWLATVNLRQAELLLLSNQTSSALQLSQAALKDFPQYACANQFRFLVARCQIAQVEFEVANQTLKLMTEYKLGNSDTDVAQAWWMLGEVDFLQRNYRDALQKYTQVLEVNVSTAWHARALIQAGKCYELLGAPNDALSLYQRVTVQFPQSEVASAAQSRIQQLTNALTNTLSNTDSSAKTQAVNPTPTTSTISR